MRLAALSLHAHGVISDMIVSNVGWLERPSMQGVCNVAPGRLADVLRCLPPDTMIGLHGRTSYLQHVP